MDDQTKQFVLYTTDSGDVKLEVFMQDDTIWLSQAKMSELFDVDRTVIGKHIVNIFTSGELDEKGNVQKMHVANSAKPVSYYNLDVIIAVGYRVNSRRATQFRVWASGVLKEYIIKGFTMNDERLKGNGGGNYWKELLDRIRDIRSSEKVLYRQVLDLYATSTDYDPKSKETVDFFKTVQNKLHYATNQQTAAELIHGRADSGRDFMGMTTFAGAQPTFNEATVAKNYLTSDELFRLSRLVSAFFDLAEIKAQAEDPMRMIDWVAELDKFAGLYGKGQLDSAGAVSHKQAVVKAEQEYRKYQVKALSPVETAYLESVKQLEKKISKDSR
jgi:hypothetical protein